MRFLLELTITWSLNGPQNTDFNKGNITFEIGDGSNPNNVLPVTNGALTFAKAPIVGDLTAITTIPAVANGKNYTIKATFRDAAAGKFLNWFSPNFAVQGSSVVVPPASSSAAAASSAAASGTAANTIKTISVTSEGRSSGISQTSVLLALVPALLLAF
ncbi:hypothetical protein BCR33DRAFT_506290 [Rhizoclosmatium globosum]|uniref:Uncharacterized protein n=1 Tax=Rhizoclosmatium globosum TaxID=329046 RepID=A0A1Y2BKG7_9FUNG|nr:hypothetical protein BCR33DRAFT_506290 [Rhizoclosmatium globosum]|eukprot:ORY35268.1 hypothetical protein BCR33DRAFT_506290 [Rhizoclosmatium globosum]